MVAALLEWVLWLGAFLYCLFKVYRKAEHWSVKVLALLVGITFTTLRCVMKLWCFWTLLIKALV
jgi:chitin synthase